MASLDSGRPRRIIYGEKICACHRTRSSFSRYIKNRVSEFSKEATGVTHLYNATLPLDYSSPATRVSSPLQQEAKRPVGVHCELSRSIPLPGLNVELAEVGKTYW